MEINIFTQTLSHPRLVRRLNTLSLPNERRYTQQTHVAFVSFTSWTSALRGLIFTLDIAEIQSSIHSLPSLGWHPHWRQITYRLFKPCQRYRMFLQIYQRDPEHSQNSTIPPPPTNSSFHIFGSYHVDGWKRAFAGLSLTFANQIHFKMVRHYKREQALSRMIEFELVSWVPHIIFGKDLEKCGCRSHLSQLQHF